jgi:hypothetical protein
MARRMVRIEHMKLLSDDSSFSKHLSRGDFRQTRRNTLWTLAARCPIAARLSPGTLLDLVLIQVSLPNSILPGPSRILSDQSFWFLLGGFTVLAIYPSIQIQTAGAVRVLSVFGGTWTSRKSIQEGLQAGLSLVRSSISEPPHTRAHAEDPSQ